MASEVRKTDLAFEVGRIEVSVLKVVAHIGALVERVGAHTHSTGPQMGTSQTDQMARKILKIQRVEVARTLASDQRRTNLGEVDRNP